MTNDDTIKALATRAQQAEKKLSNFLHDRSIERTDFELKFRLYDECFEKQDEILNALRSDKYKQITSALCTEKEAYSEENKECRCVQGVILDILGFEKKHILNEQEEKDFIEYYGEISRDDLIYFQRGELCLVNAEAFALDEMPPVLETVFEEEVEKFERNLAKYNTAVGEVYELNVLNDTGMFGFNELADAIENSWGKIKTFLKENNLTQLERIK